MSNVERNNGAIVLKGLLILLAGVGIAIVFFICLGLLPDPHAAIIIYALILFWLLRSAICRIFGRKK